MARANPTDPRQSATDALLLAIARTAARLPKHEAAVNVLAHLTAALQTVQHEDGVDPTDDTRVEPDFEPRDDSHGMDDEYEHSADRPVARATPRPIGFR